MGAFCVLHRGIMRLQFFLLTKQSDGALNGQNDGQDDEQHTEEDLDIGPPVCPAGG